jgi:hypothetical protein
MKKINLKIQLIVFLLFIALFFALLLVLPDRSFSEQENRYLQKRPAFSLSALFKGSFTSDFESYITDQFPFRDRWLDIKSRSERLLLKTENNNVFFCKDGALIERFEEPDMELVDDNIASVNALIDNTSAQVYLALIPNAAEIWSYKLPKYAVSCNQKELIDYIYSRVSAKTVDIYTPLAEHKDDYIFYNTDHHWTSLGAYYGYSAIKEAMGLTPPAIEAYTPVTQSEDFYGTVYSSSGVRWVEPDSIETYVSDEGIKVTNYSSGKAEEGKVYDLSFLDKKDKYAMFFGGNTPRMVIETSSEGGKLLILRDSYADAGLPFLFDSFGEIHVLDLRYFKTSVKNYIEQNEIETVIVSYGLKNFVTDNSVFMMGF